MNKKPEMNPFRHGRLFRFSLNYLRQWENRLSSLTEPLAEHRLQLNIFITDDKIASFPLHRAFAVIDPQIARRVDRPRMNRRYQRQPGFCDAGYPRPDSHIRQESRIKSRPAAGMRLPGCTAPPPDHPLHSAESVTRISYPRLSSFRSDAPFQMHMNSVADHLQRRVRPDSGLPKIPGLR